MMLKKKRLFIALFIGLVLAGLALPVAAQGNDLVQATVDRTALTTDETLTLSVTVDEGAGVAGAPLLPALPGFDLLSSSSSRQITIRNGDIQVQTVYYYVLHPTQAGDLVIAPISVEINGRGYQTAPIAITVSAGTGNPVQSIPRPGFPAIPGFPSLPAIPGFPGLPAMPVQPVTPGPGTSQGGELAASELPAELSGQDFYVDALVDHPRPFQGEQVIYRFRFYQAVELFEQPEYSGPSFTGFWHEQIAGQTEYTAQAGGRNYLVTEIQTVLFPTVVGAVTIDPATLVIPGGFFSRGQTLSTRPLMLDVQALPDPVPAGFTGAVGHFTLESATADAVATVNETVSWDVVLRGRGNIGSLADPAWTEGPEWRSFDSEPEVSARLLDGVWQGSRTYQRVLVPTQAGDLTLPAVEYVFFNPTTGVYETASSPPLMVMVNAGAGVAAPVAPLSTSGTPGTLGAAVAGQLPLKPLSAWGGSRLLVEMPVFWLLWLVPPALLVGHAVWRRYRQQRAATAASRRMKGAAGDAQRSLRRAEGHPEQAGRILESYLATRLNRSVAGLTHAALTEALLHAGASPAQAERVPQLLLRSDALRYAPGTVEQGSELIADTDRLIAELDKALQ